MLELETVVEAVSLASSLVTQGAALLAQVQAAASSNDPAALQAALTKIRAANDALGAE